jgi:hypothetical protein
MVCCHECEVCRRVSRIALVFLLTSLLAACSMVRDPALREGAPITPSLAAAANGTARSSRSSTLEPRAFLFTPTLGFPHPDQPLPPTTTWVPALPDRTRTPVVTAVSTPLVVRDCGWSREIRTWIDLDNNGVRDIGEPPLAGVMVSAQRSDSAEAMSGQTDSTGQMRLTLGLFSCDAPIPVIIVSALSMDNYALTTAASLRSDQTEAWAYHFGLIPIGP